jgi:hypothetical protein
MDIEPYVIPGVITLMSAFLLVLAAVTLYARGAKQLPVTKLPNLPTFAARRQQGP